MSSVVARFETGPAAPIVRSGMMYVSCSAASQRQEAERAAWRLPKGIAHFIR